LYFCGGELSLSARGAARGRCSGGAVPESIFHRATDAAHDAAHNTRSCSGSAVFPEGFAVTEWQASCKPFAYLLHWFSSSLRKRAFTHTTYDRTYYSLSGGQRCTTKRAPYTGHEAVCNGFGEGL
jgi:hypothetical protein